MKTNSILSTIFAFSFLFFFSCSEELSELTNLDIKGVYDLTSYQVAKEETLKDGIKAHLEFTADSDKGGKMILTTIQPNGGKKDIKTSVYIITDSGTNLWVNEESHELTFNGSNLRLEAGTGEKHKLIKGIKR